MPPMMLGPFGILYSSVVWYRELGDTHYGCTKETSESKIRIPLVML